MKCIQNTWYTLRMCSCRVYMSDSLRRRNIQRHRGMICQVAVFGTIKVDKKYTGEGQALCNHCIGKNIVGKSQCCCHSNRNRRGKSSPKAFDRKRSDTKGMLLMSSSMFCRSSNRVNMQSSHQMFHDCKNTCCH